MNSESGSNGVANILRLAPINFSPAVVQIPLSSVLANRNFQLAAFSTGLIGTGLALSAYYPSIFNGGHHVYTVSSNKSFTWLEYPADYAPPVMDFFVEDQVPFGVSSSLSCPKNSEHLEKAFDLLQYQHLSKTLGVPSVIHQHTLFRLFRILGNTSSGSFEFLAIAKLARFIQGGPRNFYGGSTGGEKNANDEPRASNPRITQIAVSNSTRLPPVSGDDELKVGPAFHPIATTMASIVCVAITVFTLLAKRFTTPKNIREVQEANLGGDIKDDNEINPSPAEDGDESGSSYLTTTSPMASAIANPTQLPPASGDKELKEEPEISMVSLIVAITVFCLLARRRRAQRPSSPPSAIPVNGLEVQQAVSDTNANDDSDNVYRKDCTPVPVKTPSPRLVFGVFINPEHWNSVERLFEDDPLAESYIPCVVLKFLDVNPPVQSNVGSLEDDSSPDGFAARFDAPQDNLLSLQNMVEYLPTSHDLARFIVFGTAIYMCFVLRLMGFLVTGRFGRRGIKQLTKRFKNAKPSSAAHAIEIVDDETLPLHLVETPARQEIVPPGGGSEVSSSSNSCGIVGCIQDAYEKIVAAMITLQPSSSASTPATLVGRTVETFLAPVVHEEKVEVNDDDMHCRMGKVKVIVPEDDETVEPLSMSHNRLRGRRGHGRGRSSPVADGG